ncbi:MAG: hypothetical protein JNK56_07055 [Myxococcales bacterium]|nr:hypothetical protein [Myxococcales bacterium]
MNGQTLAHVRRVLTGHSDRALIHAVNDAGHELKLEVPAEAVRGVEADRGFVLMVSWSLLALPRAAEPAAAPTGAAADPPVAASTSTPTPANAADAEFMALMARTRRSTPEPAPSPTASSATGPEHQIAALLGLAPNRST